MPQAGASAYPSVAGVVVELIGDLDKQLAEMVAVTLRDLPRGEWAIVGLTHILGHDRDGIERFSRTIAEARLTGRAITVSAPNHRLRSALEALRLHCGRFEPGDAQRRHIFLARKKSKSI